MTRARRPWPVALEKVVSGGQTGVDRAALDAALEVGMPCGGWCPRGRLSEDGAIPESYALDETPSPDPAQRTAWNVRDSDATLVLTAGPPAGGTAYTLEAARELGKPYRIVDLREEEEPVAVRAWLEAHAVRTLNVAGPRESEQPGIYRRARTWLERLLAG